MLVFNETSSLRDSPSKNKNYHYWLIQCHSKPIWLSLFSRT